MNITPQQAKRFADLVGEIKTALDEIKDIARDTMSRHEYEQFKYRTLGHLEPAVSKETEWVTTYSSIDSLEKVAEEMGDEAGATRCKKCESPLEDDFCTDISCPYSGHEQHEEIDYDEIT